MGTAIGWALLAVTLAFAVLISLYFGIDSVYTQIFYIPIILTGLWNYRKAMYVALLFGLIHVFLGIFLITVAYVDVSMADQLIRAAMYLLVAGVVGTLSERQASLLGRVKDSEEKYRFIASSIDEGIIAIDLEGRVTYANPRTYEITGYRPGESTGRPVVEILAPASRQEIQKMLEKVLAAGAAIEHDMEFVTKAGNRIDIELNTSVIRDSGGRISGVVATFRDVSGRKQTRAALQSSRDFYLTLLESFPGLIWRTGPDGNGTYFNRNWLDFTGRTAAEQAGDGWLAGIHEQDREQHLRRLKEAFGARQAFECEYRMRRGDGTFRWLLESGQPFRDMDGSFAGYIGFVYDITERKAASEEIERRNRELRLLNAISSSINHARDVPGMLYSVLADAMSLAQARSGAVYLADDARPGQLKLWAALPYANADTPETFKPAFTPAVRVDTSRVGAMSAGGAECLAAPAGSGTVVSVPIQARSRLVGLMVFLVGGSDAGLEKIPEQTEAQLLSTGTQLGIAIENQTLFRQVRATGGSPGIASDLPAGYDQAYHFNKGVIYLMDKGRVGHYMDIFADQVRHDIRGLCVTRLNPQTVRDRYGLNTTPLIWLNAGEAPCGSAAIRTGDVATLAAAIGDFMARDGDGAIMLDGMEYLLARNGFEPMLKFVQLLNDKIMTSNSRAFFCIDTGTLDDKQKHLLLTEMKEFRERG